MKTVTFEVTFKIEMEMPDDYDVVDVMCELDYEFYPDDNCTIMDTDMTDWDVLNTERDN